MKILSDFKKFAIKGNVIDLAVGIIIGVEFGKIVSSLVKDIIMPPIGFLIGNINISDLALDLNAYTGIKTPINIAYGQFIQTSINFIIIAFAVFLLITLIDFIKRKEVVAAPPPPPAPTKEEILLTEIRDLLKNKQI